MILKGVQNFHMADLKTKNLFVPHERHLVNINQVQPNMFILCSFLPLTGFDLPKSRVAEFRSEKVHRG